MRYCDSRKGARPRLPAAGLTTRCLHFFSGTEEAPQGY